MGQQIGFFATERDHGLLLDQLQELGCRALPPLIPTDTRVDPVAPNEYDWSAGEYFYLLPPDVPVAEAFYIETTDDPETSILMPDRSAVIQFKPSRRDGRTLREGRLYIGLPKEDRWYQPLGKTYAKIAKRVRQWPRTDQFRFHVGPHALALVQEGEVDLMHLRYRLHPEDSG